jgi:RimJ/RimL family protein N-acetyltransferase
MRGALARVRPAAPDDCDKLLEWRNAPHVRAASRETAVIGLADHRAWFQRTLAASDRWLLVGDVEGVETGVVRFDRIEPDVAEVSIYTSPAARPGDGTALLAAAEAWLAEAQPDMQAVQAEYRADNLPSRTLFSNAGYAPLPTAGYGSHTMITRKRLRSEKASG